MSVPIKVKCFNGKAYDVDVNPDVDQVSDLQGRIAELSDIASERQTLLFKGQVLEPTALVRDYPIVSGVTISVVRRVGKAPQSSVKNSTAPAGSALKGERADAQTGPKRPVASAADAEHGSNPPATDVKVTSNAAPTDPDVEAVPEVDTMENLMRNFGLGGTGGMGGMGGVGGMDSMGGLGSLASMLGPSGLGGADAATTGPSLEKLMSQMPMMMNGLMQSPALQEYLNDPSKQEASRNAIVNNPVLKSWLESDPEFAKVVSDPEKWKQSMDAARSLFAANPSSNSTNPLVPDLQQATSSGSKAKESSRSVTGVTAPPGINIAKLSESYGHALGQSLVNSGLGLDPDLVIKGFRSACDGLPFPMSLPEYERSMAKLQSVAAEYLEKSNLEDANHFFSEIKKEEKMVILEPGKVAYEPGDVEPEAGQPSAEADSTVLVIVTARLLDGRHFFTCPAADETGETVHPLTLPLATAPPALAKGIVGMKETESRMLFVHPSAADGMAEMFGDLLPPNALLIFDLQLVSANAPEEEVAAAREAAAALAGSNQGGSS